MKKASKAESITPKPTPEITYAAKVSKFAVDDNNHLIVTLDISVPSPETLIGMYEAKKSGKILDCINVLSANSLTSLDENKHETDNQKTKDGTDGVDRGRFIKQRN